MRIFALVAILLVAGVVSHDDCHEDKESCMPESRAMLSKKNKQKLVSDTSEEATRYRYKPRRASEAMTYFKRWHQAVTEITVDAVEGNSAQSLVQGEELMNILPSALVQQYGCSERLLEKQNWSLIKRETWPGVSHMLFKKAAGMMQFISMRKNRIVAADPPMNCAAELQLEDPVVVGAGVPKSVLHPDDDKLVKDCKTLFERTVKDVCKKDMKIRVKSAALEVIDGFSVQTTAEIVGPAGKTTHHTPRCLFEWNPGQKDASLLETITDPATNDPVEEERMGMTASIETHSELCKADEEDGKNIFKDVRPMGLLSMYKGYEHLETSPLATFVEDENLPQDLDLRKRHPKCFKDGGKEVIRDQASCGSCWAFAGATAIMNTLCTSRENDASLYASPTDRYEVSVQQLMSCNAGKAGCQGGINGNVASAATLKGLSMERNQPYRCATGKPENHWNNQMNGDCGKWPWGATCQEDQVPKWRYGGAYLTTSIPQIMTLMNQGVSLTVSMMVYESFQKHGHPQFSTAESRKKVYNKDEGQPLSGHAMATLGYGVQDGEKYWLIQNSWSKAWGVDGTIKVLRGVDLSGVDTGMYYHRSWVEGGAKPPQPTCVDSPGGIDGLKNPPITSCRVALQYLSCEDYPARMKLGCPVTCNTCPKRESEAPPQAPQTTEAPPRPTREPTPQTTEAPPRPTREPTTTTPAPPSSNGASEIVRMGPSTRTEKCAPVQDTALSFCTLTTTIQDASVFSTHTAVYENEKVKETMQVCLRKEGGWTEDATLRCKKPSGNWFD